MRYWTNCWVQKDLWMKIRFAFNVFNLHFFQSFQRWPNTNVWTSFELQSAKLPVLGSLTLFDLIGFIKNPEVTSPSLLETAPKGLAETVMVGLSWFHKCAAPLGPTDWGWTHLSKDLLVQDLPTVGKPEESTRTLWFLAGLQVGAISLRSCQQDGNNLISFWSKKSTVFLLRNSRVLHPRVVPFITKHPVW